MDVNLGILFVHLLKKKLTDIDSHGSKRSCIDLPGPGKKRMKTITMRAPNEYEPVDLFFNFETDDCKNNMIDGDFFTVVTNNECETFVEGQNAYENVDQFQIMDVPNMSDELFKNFKEIRRDDEDYMPNWSPTSVMEPREDIVVKQKARKRRPTCDHSQIMDPETLIAWGAFDSRCVSKHEEKTCIFFDKIAPASGPFPADLALLWTRVQNQKHKTKNGSATHHDARMPENDDRPFYDHFGPGMGLEEMGAQQMNTDNSPDSNREIYGVEMERLRSMLQGTPGSFGKQSLLFHHTSSKSQDSCPGSRSEATLSGSMSGQFSDG